MSYNTRRSKRAKVLGSAQAAARAFPAGGSHWGVPLSLRDAQDATEQGGDATEQRAHVGSADAGGLGSGASRSLSFLENGLFGGCPRRRADGACILASK